MEQEEQTTGQETQPIVVQQGNCLLSFKSGDFHIEVQAPSMDECTQAMKELSGEIFDNVCRHLIIPEEQKQKNELAH